MAEFIEGFYDKVESILPMEGAMSVPLRAGIGAGLGYLLIMAFRPSASFNPDGTPRPWAVLPELYAGRGTPTHLPFLVGPLAGAVLLAGFV